MRKEFRYGKKIQELREAREWTQEQLAEATGIYTVRTIQRVERDLTKNHETIQAIAGALDVDLASLRSTWLIPETRLVRTAFVTSHREFVRVDTSPSDAFGRMIMAPLTEDGTKRVEELLDQIFADRELIEPYETDLWSGYVEQVEEPLESLFALNLAVLVVDETRDMILRNNDSLPLEKRCMDWRVRYFLVVPKHGCFRLDSKEPLHRFNGTCAAGNAAILRAATQRDIPGIHVVANALVAISRPDFYGDGINWCESCFPADADGTRISFDYIELVTGLDRAKLHSLWQEATGNEFLHGLA
jgi:transcriptional regulator with XRE-family HTH domain